MWYLTHRDPKENTSVYCSLLQHGRKYTIGRAKKSDFIINSPSVSSNHLAVQLGHNGALEIYVYGKSTYIGPDYIDRRTFTPDQAKVPEVRQIKKSETVMLSSGKLASVGLRYKKLFLCVSSDALVDVPALHSMGISTNDFCSSDTTHMVVQEMRNSTTQLEALIRQIPIVSIGYVEQLINNRDALAENFEENFPDSSKFIIDPQYSPNPLRTTLFKGLTFVFTESTQFEIMKPVLQQAKAHCVFFSFADSSGANDYVSFVKKETERKQTIPILIQMTVPEVEFVKSHADLSQQTAEVKQMAIITEASKRLGLYLVTTRDIFNAVLLCSTEHLTRKRPERSRSPDPDVKLPPLKKSRRGVKVKPLDSLDFFAGGGKTEAQQQSQQLPQIKESMEKEPQIPQKKQRSRIKPLENQMLDTKFSPSLENDKSQALSASIDVPSSISEKQNIPATQATSPQPEDIQQDEPMDEVPDSEEDEALTEAPLQQQPEKKKRPLTESPTTQQQSFSSAIIQAKKRADERIKKEFGTGLPLEEDLAVEHLRDLAIVEDTDMPLRKTQDRSQEAPLSERWDPKWSGRKNYKVFVKNSKNKNANGVGRIASVREFVSFEIYDPAYDIKMTELDEDMLAIVQRGQAEREEAGAASAAVNDNATRQATVVDPHPKKKKPIPLFVASDESDDDYEETRFHFGDDGDDGLDMGLRVSEPQNVPEFRREFGTRALTDAPVTSATPVVSRAQSTRSITTSATTVTASRPASRHNFNDADADDDDDDDDVVDGIPRFRFG